MKKYSKALSSYEKPIEIRQKTLLPNHPNLTIYYDNISEVYLKVGKYSKAIEIFEILHYHYTDLTIVQTRYYFVSVLLILFTVHCLQTILTLDCTKTINYIYSFNIH